MLKKSDPSIATPICTKTVDAKAESGLTMELNSIKSLNGTINGTVQFESACKIEVFNSVDEHVTPKAPAEENNIEVASYNLVDDSSFD